MAAFIGLAFLLVGLYLATWSVLIPVLLALWLFSAGVSFLGARLNPLSLGFYLHVKPSWTAILVIFFSGLILLYAAYFFWKHGWGPVVPKHLVPW